MSESQNSQGEIVLVMGYPASGKTTVVEEFEGYQRFNRDEIGGRLSDLLPLMKEAIDQGQRFLVLDNTYGTSEQRAPVINLGKEHGIPVRCIWLGTSIEDAQFNACQRMCEQYGRLLMPDEIASSADANTFPPAVLFQYRTKFEAPSEKEGFAAVEKRPFVRAAKALFEGKALFLDYDGTLRHTKSGAKYPTSPDDVEVLPNRAEVLKRYIAEGYRLFGVSNQSAVGSGKATREQIDACFQRTNELLGLEIEVSYCPHAPGPIKCFCRKPMPGLGVALIEKHELDRDKVTMIGDMTSDKTFAKRCGIAYVDANEFFAS